MSGLPTGPALTVDCVAFDAEGRILLIRRGHPPFEGAYALPGGFVEPMFVLEIEPATRVVVIGPREALARSDLRAEGANWLDARPEPGERVGVRIRHGAPIVDATVTEATDAGFALTLELPQRAVTPGQSAVLYRDDTMVGGAVII